MLPQNIDIESSRKCLLLDPLVCAGQFDVGSRIQAVICPRYTQKKPCRMTVLEIDIACILQHY